MLDQLPRYLPGLSGVGVALLVAGCMTLQASTPGDHALQQGLTLVRTLPEQLPAKSAAFPHAPFVLIQAESAAGMLVPIPFVSEAIGSVIDASAAAASEAHYATIDPYRIVGAALAQSPLLARGPSALTLHPFVFIQECVDDRYRLTLVAHLQSAEWVGRYLLHLPTTYSADEYARPAPATLATLRTELEEAAVQLRALLERAARGDLRPSGVRVDIGSLHLVGGRAVGLVSPTLMLARNADLIEEGPQHVLVRMRGDMTQAATAGGLYFGVHRLRKDQLHTFRKLPGAGS